MAATAATSVSFIGTRIVAKVGEQAVGSEGTCGAVPGAVPRHRGKASAARGPRHRAEPAKSDAEGRSKWAACPCEPQFPSPKEPSSGSSSDTAAHATCPHKRPSPSLPGALRS